MKTNSHNPSGCSGYPVHFKTTFKPVISARTMSNFRLAHIAVIRQEGVMFWSEFSMRSEGTAAADAAADGARHGTSNAHRNNIEGQPAAAVLEGAPAVAVTEGASGCGGTGGRSGCGGAGGNSDCGGAGSGSSDAGGAPGFCGAACRDKCERRYRARARYGTGSPRCIWGRSPSRRRTRCSQQCSDVRSSRSP